MIFPEDAARSWLARAGKARDEINHFVTLGIAFRQGNGLVSGRGP